MKRIFAFAAHMGRAPVRTSKLQENYRGVGAELGTEWFRLAIYTPDRSRVQSHPN
jgi:hypothetical protein